MIPVTDRKRVSWERECGVLFTAHLPEKTFTARARGSITVLET
jgi:hypothetical protein